MIQFNLPPLIATTTTATHHNNKIKIIIIIIVNTAHTHQFHIVIMTVDYNVGEC